MDFPEQYSISEMIAQMLEDKGEMVDRHFKLSGDLLRTAIEEGRIDCYVEYTGALYTLPLRQRPISDPDAVYNYVKREYAKKHIALSKPFKFDNPWAILIRADDALRLKIYKISDLAKVAPEWKAAVVPDFVSDHVAGAATFKRDYGLKFALESTLALATIYQALSKGEVDIISGNATDPELLDHEFVQLEDDRHHFPPYYPVILARQEIMQRSPALQEIMKKLPEKINLAEMRTLNYQVRANPNNYPKIVGAWRNASGL